MIEKVHRYIREYRLLSPGDRVHVAVSGGADSVALFRGLLELRPELGIVIAAAHFNHRIRGDEADADEEFVRNLAQQFGVEFHCASADVPAYARERKLSLETAARELRHAWFADLIRQRSADKIATAHTQDDQAETVLMRVLRGAGTRGLAGISPLQAEKSLVRPLLGITRAEVEAYLRRLGQPWREDSSNQDLRHARNRLRHELLPLLQREYNPAIRQTLADLAEIARADEEYWDKEIASLLARLVRFGKPSRSGRTNREQQSGAAGSRILALELAALQLLPLAVQRRLLRGLGEKAGTALEFKHIQQLMDLVGQKAGQKEAGQKKSPRTIELPGGWIATRSLRELQLAPKQDSYVPGDYCYPLRVPGEVELPELGSTIRARVLTFYNENDLSGYNSALLLNRALLAPELTVRNWRSGDKFFPAHTRSPKKVKELLQPGRLGQELSRLERRIWPVVESAGELVWMRGFPVPEAFATKTGQAVLIEEVTINELGAIE
jgi:tRNA(Ile)-lysidine synthase